MLKELLKPEILELMEARDWNGLRESLAGWPAPEVADLLLHLRREDRVLFFRALARDVAAAAFAYLQLHQQDELLHDLTAEETRGLLQRLPPDDRTQLLAELPGQAMQRLLNLLPERELEEARWLLGYPEDSVGRLMTPNYVAVHPEWTMDEVLRHLRAHGADSETMHRVFVIDGKWHLLDAIELRRFVLAPTDAKVRDLMDHRVVSVPASANRREAVALIRRYDSFVLPVVDSDGVLVGIVTIDDVLDVQEQEATEDFHRVGSVDPLRTSLRDATVSFLYQRRIGWLMALVFVNILSGAGIAAFEGTIQAAVALVFFLPLLIGSGGNAGAQSATLVVRALATGDVRNADWMRMLTREFMVSLLLGLTMAAAVAAIAWWRAPHVAIIVALTMTFVVVWGSLIGMLLPFVLIRIGRDPATASAPLITSLADISGVLIYFSVASAMLPA